MATQLKAVIFDVDGTLAETERNGHRIAFNRAFLDAGLDWNWDEALYGKLLAVTDGKERIRYFLTDFNSDFKYDGDMDQFIVDLHVSKNKHYVDLIENQVISLRPGIRRMMNGLRCAGLRMAIATTTAPANVSALIKSTLGEEALEWFDCIAAGDIVSEKKPAPDVFNYCLEQIGLSAEECLAFEGSGNGVKSSVGAKISTIVTLNDYTKEDDFSGACGVLTHLGDIDEPCQVLSGEAIEGDYLTVNDLISIHAKG